MLDPISKLLRQMSADSDPAAIALAISFGMIIGFTPLWSLHNLLVLFLVSLIRVNWSAFLAAWGLFSAFAYLLDPLFHQFGYYLLTHSALQGLWTELYNITLWRLEHFYNTLVMGSLSLSLLAFIPNFFLSQWLILRYRSHVLAFVKRSRLLQALKANKWLSPFLPDLGN